MPHVRRPAVAEVLGALAAVALPAAALGGCAALGGSATFTGATPGVVNVAAAENFWGSVAAQVGGRHARVISIITNPATDPHSYEPTTVDARTVAGAQLVVENGIGYDPWMPKLLAADTGDRTVLDVGALLGVPDGGNPHRWYDPDAVVAVTRRVVADLQRIDPRDRAYFASRGRWFTTVALHDYFATIAAIRARYRGVPVGASESIFSMQAPALGLDLVTPYSLLKAVSEGTEVSAADKATVDDQIRHHLIKAYVYNSQNVTPDVQAELAEVRAAGIPYTTITETLDPAGDTFQEWQTRQLRGIEDALARGTGRQ